MRAQHRGATRDVIAAEPGEARLAPVRDEPSGAGQVTPARSSSSRAARESVKILFVAANAPREPLALDVEYRAIEESIRAARHRDAFQLIPKLAARPSDVQQALLEHRPDVVHFACHGTAHAELLLAAEHAGAAHVPAEALASTFRVLRDNVRLVVFNACFAGEQAQALGQDVGLAIGLRARIEDAAAIAFASALYGALAFGRSVRDAFDLGVAAIQAAHPEQAAPELFAAPGLDASAVRLVGGRARPARRSWALGGAAVCAALGLVGWLLRAPERGEAPARPSHGMVRFSGGALRPGVFAMARRPAVCASLTADEDASVREHPEEVAEVRVSPFELDVDEVTNGQFADWLNAQADAWKVAGYGIIQTRQNTGIRLALASEQCLGGLTITPEGRIGAGAGKARWPVVCVTWYGASAYCRAHGKRLPREAEWELVAKGPSGRPFPWGAELPGHDGVTFDLRDGAAAHPGEVGSSPQDVTPEGVRDLGGSVAEWVEDNRGLASEKTIRGGSWASRGPCHVLGSGKKRVPAERFAKDVGFRCARSVLGPGAGGEETR